MPRLTVTADEEHAALMEELSNDDGQYASKSEAVRACIQAYERVAELETENDRLRREKRAVIEQRERRNAPLWKRLE